MGVGTLSCTWYGRTTQCTAPGWAGIPLTPHTATPPPTPNTAPSCPHLPPPPTLTTCASFLPTLALPASPLDLLVDSFCSGGSWAGWRAIACLLSGVGWQAGRPDSDSGRGTTMNCLWNRCRLQADILLLPHGGTLPRWNYALEGVLVGGVWQTTHTCMTCGFTRCLAYAAFCTAYPATFAAATTTCHTLFYFLLPRATYRLPTAHTNLRPRALPPRLSTSAFSCPPTTCYAPNACALRLLLTRCLCRVNAATAAARCAGRVGRW